MDPKEWIVAVIEACKELYCLEVNYFCAWVDMTRELQQRSITIPEQVVLELRAMSKRLVYIGRLIYDILQIANRRRTCKNH